MKKIQRSFTTKPTLSTSKTTLVKYFLFVKTYFLFPLFCYSILIIMCFFTNVEENNFFNCLPKNTILKKVGFDLTSSFLAVISILLVVKYYIFWLSTISGVKKNFLVGNHELFGGKNLGKQM